MSSDENVAFGDGERGVGVLVQPIPAELLELGLGGKDKFYRSSGPNQEQHDRSCALQYASIDPSPQHGALEEID
jgi:hypothetical protein